jgi:4-oxalocrotonate tautomerase
LTEENRMPLLTVKLIEGVFTPSQKKEIIRKLTDTMVEIEGESLRPYTLVIVEEIKSGDWSLGGNAFTTGDVRTLQSISQKAERTRQLANV